MVCIGRPREAGTGPELRTPGAAAQTRIVSKARIRLDSRKSVRSFKGIICVDISEFESYMPRHAVSSLRSGERGNPAGGPVGSRHRQQLNGEFIAALLRDFRHGGPKAIERVRRTQPAAYLKILALLCPREHKVEQSNVIKSLSDQELEAMIEYLKTSMESRAAASG